MLSFLYDDLTVVFMSHFEDLGCGGKDVILLISFWKAKADIIGSAALKVGTQSLSFLSVSLFAKWRL